MPTRDSLSGTPTIGDGATGRDDAAAFALAPGTLLGRYVIVDQLGAGGMASVYLAYDAQLARRVAIKVLRPDTRDPDARARMLREAQAMARLSHPNVLAVHDVGSFGDGVFIATEYVEGQTLKAWLAKPHGWRDALAVVKAAGRGLEAAHARGIVHRDFKPDNVFLGSDGRVVVGDFGIARAEDAGPELASSLAPPAETPPEPGEVAPVPDVPSGPSLSSPITRTGAMLGTVGYMSPERAFDQHDDPRSDQFSFCVTLYRALYGQPPFVYTGLSSYLEALGTPPRPPPEKSRVPSWIHRIVLRGMAFEPAARFASMTELLDALDRDPTRRRRGWMLGASGLGLAALVALGWVRHERALREECRVGETLIRTTWGPEARAKVGAGIEATAVPLASDYAARTQTALDAYAGEWARVHRRASEATLLYPQESAVTMKGRLACLEEEREELGALIDALSRADAVVARHSIGAAYGLASPQTCLEPGAARTASLAGGTPERGARLTALRRAVAEAEAHRMTGKVDEALSAATRALADARALPHRQSEAELLLLIAACKRETEDDAVARVAFEEAFAACEAAGNDSLAAIAAATISLELGDSLADAHEAERWLAIAKGIREREEHDDRADAEILEAELSLLTAEGHADRTLPLRARLIELLQRIYGTAHPRIAVAIANRAGDLVKTGQFDLGVDEYRKAIAMQELLFGPDVPMLSIYYNNLGSTLTETGRYAAARDALQRALALVAPLGATNAHNVLPLVSLAQLDNRVGDRDAALEAATRGIAIVDSGGESEVRFLPSLLVQQGEARLARGEGALAQASCARALALEDRLELLAPDKIQSGGEDALTCLGEAELALGRLEDALAHLERSVSLSRREATSELSLARFALARALTAAKREPVRARQLAETARQELRAAPGMEREALEVESWLAGSARP
jgi:tetratricopeptide (TPR) repeat protein